MRVLFLGKIGERAGGERTLDASGLSTVSDAIDRLRSEDPELGTMILAPSTIFVLDQEVVRADASLAGAQEIAFLPPVSGG